MTYMWYILHISYCLYYEYAVNPTTLSVQLHMYAAKRMAKFFMQTLKLKLKTAVLFLPGMDSTNMNRCPAVHSITLVCY